MKKKTIDPDFSYQPSSNKYFEFLKNLTKYAFMLIRNGNLSGAQKLLCENGENWLAGIMNSLLPFHDFSLFDKSSYQKKILTLDFMNCQNFNEAISNYVNNYF